MNADIDAQCHCFDQSPKGQPLAVNNYATEEVCKTYFPFAERVSRTHDDRITFVSKENRERRTGLIILKCKNRLLGADLTVDFATYCTMYGAYGGTCCDKGPKESAEGCYYADMETLACDENDPYSCPEKL